MKKIIIFSSFISPHLGGVERYTDGIVSELVKNNVSVIVVTSNYNNIDSYEKKDNYDIYRLPVYKVFKNRYPIIKKNKEFREIFAKLKKEKCDAIICQTRFYSITQVGINLSKKLQKSPIIIEHGSNHVSVNNKVLDSFGALYEHYLTRKIKKANARFYGVSNKCNEWLKHFNIKSNGTFYNSVNKNLYKRYHKDIKNNGHIIITYVGRIIKEKGVELLLNSFVKLQKKYNNIDLFIAGDGPLLQKYKKQFNNPNINFTGLLNNEEVMRLLDKTDILVHPSMYPEGLPTGILEAGAMKCAVIATNRGGTNEVIIDKETGLIMEENEESLIKCLTYLLKNKKKIEILKSNLEEKIKKEFTWDIIVNKILKEVNK